MPQPPSEFVEPSRFRMYSITPGSLRTAAKMGLLREAEHYVNYRGVYFYHRDKIRALVPEIRNLRARWKKFKSKNLRKRPVAVLVNSQRKMDLAKEINSLVLQERQLEEDITRLIQARRELEFKFDEIYWQREHCPFCQGTAQLGEDVCCFCKEITL